VGGADIIARKGRLLLIVSVAVVTLLFVSISLWMLRPIPDAGSSGTMFANDSGQSHGGFEWAGEYDVSLESYFHGPRTLTVSLRIGLGDQVQIHSVDLQSWEGGYDDLTLVSDHWTMVLERNANGSGSNDYVAEWSPSGIGEGIGQVRPSWFGLPDTYYLRIELEAIGVY